MAIIKNGRINIWNAVKKQFEVVHPETETARITDFADGIVQKLALTSAMTAVTALRTDSWFGKLLKMTLTASGVKYNVAENGYVCLGSLFGGLIIQWGNNISVTSNGYGVSMEYPITFANKALAVIPYDVNDGWTDSAAPYVHAAWYPGEGSDNDGNDRRWARVGFSEKSTVFGEYRYIAIGK